MARRWWLPNVGAYNTTWWRPENGVKPKYREEKIQQRMPDSPGKPVADYYNKNVYRDLDEAEIIKTEFTVKNSTSAVRWEQYRVLNHHGYGGPISGGEARALRNLFTELGKEDLVVRGWSAVDVWVNRPPSRYLIRRAYRAGLPVPKGTRSEVERLQSCYMFKSPIDGIHFDKFVKLARMYKDDSGKLRKAVLAVMANPEAIKEIEAVDALDILSNMAGL